ncbi:MAG: protein kinase [Rudaea sp.]
MNATSGTTKCGVCGASRDVSLPDGLCARCIVAFALAPATESDEAFADARAAHAAASFAGRQVGRYHLIGEIDRGGVGVVYRAWQGDLKREVAVKMLLSAKLETRDTVTRFRREAELMANLDHPGILPVYEVGEQDGVPYFSMKLAEGGNLAQRVESLRGHFRECAQLVVQIARAIGHAHRHGVLHRDLKPSNIVFDANDWPLVTDFGLARLLAEDSTLTGSDALIGTPRYVAPEAIITPGTRLTAAADIYGLGAILYELLSGRAPFADLTPLQVLQQISTRRPRPPRQLAVDIPPALDAICLRCLEKRPQDRYASADALADALQPWLANARPSVFGGLKLGLPSRRRRAGALAAVLLVAGVALAGTWYALREPIPTPDPFTAAHTVAIIPTRLQKSTPAEREAARQLAARLEVPAGLNVLPFEETLTRVTSANFPNMSAMDIDATLGAFNYIEVKALEEDARFVVRVSAELREERLYEAEFTLADVDAVARKAGDALVRRRLEHPAAEERLPRSALALLMRAIRLLDDDPGVEGKNAAAIAALKDMITQVPDSALAHAWLAYAYSKHGGDGFWQDSAIDEAAHAQHLDPKLGAAVKTLGHAYLVKSWLSRSTKALEQAIEMGSLFVEDELSVRYLNAGRFDEAYRLCLERQRWDYPDTEALMAHLLFAVDENDAGERTMRTLMADETDQAVRTVQEAEIAMYRRDPARCRALAGSIKADTTDGFWTAYGLVRNCAIQQNDFAAALASLEPSKHFYATDRGNNNGNNPAIKEAVLLAQLQHNERVPALLAEARQGLQAAIDSNNEYPLVTLRMAAAQRLAGEIDAAYVTLERAFSLGLTFDNQNRWDIEFLPFAADARFAALRARSEADISAQREKIAALLPAAMRAPITAAERQSFASLGAATKPTDAKPDSL